MRVRVRVRVVLPDLNRYGPEADVWSVGVIAFLLLSGEVPFGGDNEEDILRRVGSGTEVAMDGPRWRHVSKGAKDLVRKLLERDVGARLTAVQALHHPWLRSAAHAASAQTPEGEGKGKGKGVGKAEGGRDAWGADDRVIDAASLASLHAFAKYGRMRKLALRAVAGAVAGSLQGSALISDLRTQFKAMDKDGSGMISVEELRQALEQTTWKHTDREVVALMESIHGYT